MVNLVNNDISDIYVWFCYDKYNSWYAIWHSNNAIESDTNATKGGVIIGKTILGRFI